MRLRLFTSFSLALSFFAVPAVQAATDMDVTASTELRLMELKYFEHTFDKEDTEDRVERIEKLVRGEVGEGSPQDRVKQLAAVIQKDGESLSPAVSEQPREATNGCEKKGQKKSDNGAPRGNSKQADNGENADTSEVSTGDYPKITNLEKEILKQTYPGQPLPVRLERLECQAFGRPSQSSDLGARTDELETYAEQVLHDKPFAVNSEIDKPYVLGSTPHSANPNAQQALEHFFNATKRMGDEFSGRSYYPGMNQGVGPGVIPAAFPGSGLSQAGPSGPPSGFSQTSQLDDDPLAYEKSPPPPNTRMLTRVAWCEVQMFGHTFPNMHLTKRLRQLSDEIMPRDSKTTDMQLMDDLDPIEKAVIARKAGQSISSGSAAGLH